MHKKDKPSDEELKLQQIKDFERLLNMDLGSYLILNEEGKENQIKEAREKLRSHLHKYGEEMEKLTKDMDPQTAELVKNFTKSLETILDHMPNIDPKDLNMHHNFTTYLETLIKGKMK